MNTPTAWPRDFFALCHYLERLSGKARIGEIGRGPEPVRFKHDHRMAFATADIVEVTPRDQAPTEVTTAFLGLTGACSPLPEHLLEGWNQHDEDGALPALFDVWHHRLLSLLYRSVSKYSPAWQSAADGRDAWSQRLLAWTPNHLALPIWRRLRWLPHLAHRHASAAGLLACLRDLIAERVPAKSVSLQTLCGGWEPLCEQQHTRLGERQHALGDNAVVGTAVYAPASAFCVRLGPLTQSDAAWLTQPSRAAELHALVGLFTPPGMQASVVLLLRPGAHPGWPTSNARLGHNTWLGQPAGATQTTLQKTVDKGLSAA